MNTLYLYPLILAAGILQACGPPMNSQLRLGLVNPWLTSLVSFGLVTVAFLCVYALIPLPGPTTAAVGKMPWWAPLGGIVGAFAVVIGLMFVDKVGAGPLAALTIGANLSASIVVDHFGLFGMSVHPVNPWRLAGAGAMIGGMLLIAKF